MNVVTDQFTHDRVEVNGIAVHTVSVGEGPLVVFCHGFLGSWYAWRHQLPAVAGAGFRAMALDMRGYGTTSAPAAVDAYSMSHIVADVVGVVAMTGVEQAVVVGHDWGASAAWYSALMRPDVFRAVAVLSVPYRPPIPALPEGVTMNDLMRQAAGERAYYRLWFQEPGLAEAVLEADVDHTLRAILYTFSGDIVGDGVHTNGWDGYYPMGDGFVDHLVQPDRLPSWLTEDDLAFYVSEFSRTGLRGGLNWYRNLNALPTVLGPFVGAAITQPVLYLAGEHDLVAGNTQQALADLPAQVPGLRNLEILSGAGHWLQQERAPEVNQQLIAFLTSL
ncbi:alpha/beta fold hydrolase [Mycobacterium sp. URHB0021]|jgi:epoxide hydrolase A/B